MGGESRKWMMLVAITWIQAFTGTNMDFSSYSAVLKSVLGISQVQLSYVGVASDMGKALGWCSGVCLLYFPTWVVMFIAAFMGLTGYGIQWLVIQKVITLPYFLILVLSLLAGCSICWFNTVCYVLCIKHFPGNRALALSLSISFSGLSAAIYNLIANSIDPNDSKLYLLLNATVPLITSIVALPLIIHQSPSEALPPDDSHHDSANFLFLTAMATITGLHLLLQSSISPDTSIARSVLSGAILLLVLPLLTPGLVYAWKWARNFINPSFQFEGSIFTLVDDDDYDTHKEPKETETSTWNDFFNSDLREEDFYDDGLFQDDPMVVLGEEHSASLLILRCEFWLYYVAYFCGGTIGLVYSNNLGQISESLGYQTDTKSLVALYSACSFFGRLLSTLPDLLHNMMCYARTVWLVLAIVPTSVAFFLLILSDSKATLITATVLIGISSGFVFSAAVSITSELFGPNSAGVNHNILITNIPVGSLLYSLLAAIVYEANIRKSNKVVSRDGSMVCVGKDCYHETFVWWWLISLLGLVSSSLLSLRTKAAYNRSEKQKHRSKIRLLRSISK